MVRRDSRADGEGIDETELDALIAGLQDALGEFETVTDAPSDLLETSEASDVADCLSDAESTFDTDADREADERLLPVALNEVDALSVGSGVALLEAAGLFVGKTGDSLDEGL